LGNISSINADCYGCGVCQLICPVNIITNVIDTDGFIKPQIINPNKCINCGLCLKICSFNYRKELTFHRPKNAYAVWAKNSDDRFNASSGGIVPALFEHLLNEGYVVNCVEFDSASNNIVYYTPSNPTELQRGKKSKYLQAFFISEIDFEKDNVIIGTPCAIASFRRILETKHNHGKFLLIDFFCHGVPSYLLWGKYLKHIGIEHPIDAIWRDKQKEGWHGSFRMIVTGEDSTFSQSFTKGDLFYKFFLRNRCLRDSCYDNCVFKCTNSSADIRVGDLWGSKYNKDEKGVSGVLTITDDGTQALQALHKSCSIVDESSKTVTESQMKKCPRRPSSFSYVKKSLIKDIPLAVIDKKASRIELIKDIIPQKTRYYLSRIISKLLGR